MTTETAQEIPTHTIPMRPVESSQIQSIGHDPETDTLAIQFAARVGGAVGPIYHYANVTEEDFEAFASAESIGSYFYKHIKSSPDKYPYVKVSA